MITKTNSYVGRLWTPMVFHIRGGLGGWTDAKFHRLETVAFIEGTRRSVRLMRMEFEPGRGYLLGNIDQLCAPAFAPFTWINVESVNIRCLHGEIGDDLVVEDANPGHRLRHPLFGGIEVDNLATL